MTGKILEIENKRLTSFSGNYSKYKILKADLVARQWKDYEALKEERAKLQDYVDRNIVRATTAKSAQSRVKQLEKLPLPQKPYTPPCPPKFSFTYETEPYERVLEISGLNLRRGDKMLIENGSLNIFRGDRLAVVGENGTGKSTLLKEIIGGGNPNIKVGRSVKFAYYDQESANLNENNTVIAELWERHVLFGQTEIRSALARAGLFAEDMEKPVKALSGGERAKLALCIFESEHGNVLILDEPTNHLDLPAREALESALKKFGGTLVFVSHDRYFISALSEKIAEIEGGRLNVYEGGYENYNLSKKMKQDSRKREEEEVRFRESCEERARSYRSKKERAEEERVKKLIKSVETKISELEAEENNINVNLLPSVSADYLKVNELLKRLETIKLQLDSLYKQYESMIQ